MEDVKAEITNPTVNGNDSDYSYRLTLTPAMLTALLDGQAVAFEVNSGEYYFEVVAGKAVAAGD